MAYKWILNGCKIRYLSKPKPIQNQSNTIHKIIRKHKLVCKTSAKYILYNKKAHKSRSWFCYYGLLKFVWDMRWFSFRGCGSNSSGFWMFCYWMRFSISVIIRSAKVTILKFLCSQNDWRDNPLFWHRNTIW